MFRSSLLIINATRLDDDSPVCAAIEIINSRYRRYPMARTRIIATLATIAFLSTLSFAHSTSNYWVGTCHPRSPFFTTISDAVRSVPPYATIKVCPGNYPEQVLITQPLTLEGVMSGDSGAATVVVPSWTMTQYGQDFIGFDAYFQILVQGTTGPVNISNLVVDGTGGTIPSSDTTGYSVGIYFQNASGSVTNTSIRNQTAGWQSIGIYADGSGAGPSLTLENNIVRGQTYAGILLWGLVFSTPINATLIGNTVDEPTMTTILGENLYDNGILLYSSAGAVRANTVTSGQGLFIESSNLNVSGNDLNGRLPFWADRDSSTVTGNTIVCASCTAYDTAAGIGNGATKFSGNKIDAGGHATGILLSLAGTAQVDSNTIANSSIAVLGCSAFGDASGYTVTHNTVIDATTGIKMPSGNSAAPNAFLATTNAVGACY